MDNLSQMECEVCHVGAPTVTSKEITIFLRSIPEWTLEEVSGLKKLKRIFIFKNFDQALAFTNKTGALAETNGHHPAILTEWGKVTITWWTHKIKGLHKNDFIMACKTNEIYNKLKEQ